MKKLIFCIFCLASLNAQAADGSQVKRNVTKAPANVEGSNKQTGSEVNAIPAQKDPIQVKVYGEEVTLSKIVPFLLSIAGSNLSSLPPEEMLKAVESAKQMYAMERFLIKESSKKGYEKIKEYDSQFKKAQEQVSVSIFMEEMAKGFTKAQISEAYARYSKNWNRFDYKFNLIIVNDEATAKSIISALNSSVSFEKIAKEKSVHNSADNSNPGLVDFMLENMIAQQFGRELLAQLQGMNLNEVSKAPIKTANGKFAIVRFIAKRKAAVPTIENVSKNLRMQLASEKIAKMFEAEIRAGRIQFFGFDGKQQMPDDILKKPESRKKG